ncbi:hypothetical protein [Streptomyces bathyalis]|nr:hypothetical protein [Streptomyces bathyalis]
MAGGADAYDPGAAYDSGAAYESGAAYGIDADKGFVPLLLSGRP